LKYPRKTPRQQSICRLNQIPLSTSQATHSKMLL